MNYFQEQGRIETAEWISIHWRLIDDELSSLWDLNTIIIWLNLKEKWASKLHKASIRPGNFKVGV